MDLDNNFAAAVTLLDERLTHHRDQEEPFYVALMLTALGSALSGVNEEGRAVTVMQESLELCRKLGNRIMEAWNLMDLWLVHQTGPELLFEAKDIFHEMAVPAGESLTLSKLAWFSWLHAGDLDQSRQYAQEGLELALAVNYMHGISDNLGRLGTIANVEGNYAEAWQIVERALPYSMGTAYELFIHFLASVAAWGLKRFDKAREHFRVLLRKNDHDYLLAAAFMVQDGRLERAAELLGFEGRTPDALEFWQRWPIFEQLHHELEQALGFEQYRTALERGQGHDVEAVNQEIIEYFLPDGSDAVWQANEALNNPLTRRELEVLQLIADGRSNQEIADELVLSLSTIKVHTRNIYTKLEVNSRTQAIAAAQQHQLL